MMCRASGIWRFILTNNISLVAQLNAYKESLNFDCVILNDGLTIMIANHI
jgi:hypothetical protein